MKMKEKQVTLKDGTSAVLKSVDENEAEPLLAFMNKVYSETDFLALTAREVAAIDVNRQQATIAAYDKAKRGIMLAAYVNGEIVANCTVNMPAKEKESHRAGFGIAVKSEYRNKGLGAALLSTAIDFAQKVGYEQLEADTVTENVNALLLYQKLGFEAVGRFPRACKLADGAYRDYIRFVKYFKNET